MNTTKDGRYAESIVAIALQRRGLKILDTNWRTRWCEVDIVANKGKTIYFVEVKYRRSGVWGDGLDAITQTKLNQMRFAAEAWLALHEWKGQATLCVAAVSGEPPKLDDFLFID